MQHRALAALTRPWSLAVLCGLAVWGLAAAMGAVGLPHNDDWSFSDIAIRLARTGSFVLNGHESMTLVGHSALMALAARLPGPDLVAIQAATAACAVVAVAMVAHLAPARWRVVVCLTVVASPMFALLAVSAMTDIPAMAVQVAAAAQGRRAARRPTPAAVGVLGLLVVAGASIREVAAVVPAAMLLLVLWRAHTAGDGTTRRRVLAVLAASASAVAALLLWRRGLPHHFPLPASRLPRRVLLAQTVLTLGALLVPVALALLPRLRRLRASSALTGIGVAVAAIATTAVAGRPALLGDYLQPRGSLGPSVLQGPARDVLPSAVWLAIVVAAVASTAVLVACGHDVLARRDRPVRDLLARSDPDDAALGVAALAALLPVVVAIASRTLLFDRYLLAPAALLACWAIRLAVPPRPRRWPAAVATAALLTVGTVLVTDNWAFARARWDLAEQTVRDGVPAHLIDGGYEWVGAHTSRPLPFATVPAGQPWYVRFASGPTCARIVRVDRVDHGEQVEHGDHGGPHTRRYQGFLTAPRTLAVDLDDRCLRSSTAPAPPQPPPRFTDGTSA